MKGKDGTSATQISSPKKKQLGPTWSFWPSNTESAPEEKANEGQSWFNITRDEGFGWGKKGNFDGDN